MAANRDLHFPLVIVCLVFIRGYCPLPMTSRITRPEFMRPQQPHGFLTESLVLSTEDYNQLDEIITTIAPSSLPPHRGNPPKCDYNPCLEGQVSCDELKKSTGCRCQGFPLYNMAPEAPNLKSVTWNGSEVVIQWCAPNSDVKTYILTVGGQERKRFGTEQRSGAVGHIDNITKVCVVAENDSGTSDGSCMMYHPRDDSLPLKAGLIGGALGFLLLLLLAVLLWRHRRQRKQEASISMHDTAETQ